MLKISRAKDQERQLYFVNKKSKLERTNSLDRVNRKEKAINPGFAINFFELDEEDFK